MKTKAWIILLALIFVACTCLSFLLLLPAEEASYAAVYSQGEMSRIVNLSIDQEFTVTTSGGINTITVKSGKIAVTDANCPDHYCMERGFCSSGTPIVCLPNRLVIEFMGDQEIDAVVG